MNGVLHVTATSCDACDWEISLQELRDHVDDWKQDSPHILARKIRSYSEWHRYGNPGHRTTQELDQEDIEEILEEVDDD